MIGKEKEFQRGSGEIGTQDSKDLNGINGDLEMQKAQDSKETQKVQEKQ